MSATELLPERPFDRKLPPVVGLSMAATPLLLLLISRFAPAVEKRRRRAYDDIPDEHPQVLIAGFGRFGQIVARLLWAQKIPFIAIDPDDEQVDFFRRFGNQVYYGDPTHPELLRSAGAARVRVFVVAIDDVDKATTLVRLLRNNVLVLDNANLVGTAQDCLQYPGNYTYQLVASTSGGQSVSRDQGVLVSEVPQINPFAGQTFAVTAVNGSATLPGTALTTIFNADGQLTGSGGCNTYNARYSVRGQTNSGEMAIRELTNTNVFCGESEGVMAQETDFFNALRAATTYEFVTDTIVVFRNAVGQEVVRLGPAAQPR